MEAWRDSSKRRPQRWLALAVLPLLFFCATEEVRPNFLLILTDDMGTQLGAYGDLHATTPEIDKLAASGIRFDRAYSAAPECTPSRAAIFTGMAPHANGQWGFSEQSSLHPDILTAPSLLGNAGYFTGLVGKLHVNAADDQLGFDTLDLLQEKADESAASLGQSVARFLTEAGDRPFFLVVATIAPHRPYPGASGTPPWPRPHDPDAIPVPAFALDTPKFRRAQAGMYDAYSDADTKVGAILGALREAGRSDSTLVILTSDHGPALPASKSTLFEGGIRVPLLARWPGAIEAGRSTKALVSGIDILPTLLDAAGGDIHPQIQGRSFLNALTEIDPESADAVYSEQTLLAGNRYFPQRVLVGARYKYFRNLRPDIELQSNMIKKWGPEMLRAWHTDPRARFLLERQVRPNREELYDLEADPHEFTNLADDAAHSARLTRMRSDLRDWMERTRDPWLALWDYDGSEPDPLHPIDEPDGPSQRKWLDEAVRAYHPPTQKIRP